MIPSVTRPDAKVLADMRENIGRINTTPHAALAALDGPVEGAVAAVEELAHARKEIAEITVTVLLHASLDPRPGVRVAAARAMAVHPYGAITDRLAEMDLRDRDAAVSAAAHKALDDMHDVRPGCLQCSSDNYDPKTALRLPESNNPHGAFVFWPVFCSRECAVEYALDAVREDFDANAIHECLARGDFERCAEETCDHCLEAAAVGRPDAAAEEPKAPPVKPRRRARKTPATDSSTVGR